MKKKKMLQSLQVTPEETRENLHKKPSLGRRGPLFTLAAQGEMKEANLSHILKWKRRSFVKRKND